VLSRQDLLTRIWGDQSGVVGRVVDVCVMRLRRKLGEASPHLQTVRGFGYRFGEAGPVCSLSV
jgi:two-component system phosphate regulon response regulator PhoB